MNELKKAIRKVSNQNSAILLIWLLLIFIFSIILSVLKEIGVFGNVLNYSLLIWGVFQYLIALPLAIFDRRRTKNGKSIPKLKDVFCKPQASGKEIARWIIISLFFIYAVTYFSNALFTFIQSLTGTELHAIDFAADNTAMSRFTNVLLMMFLAPLFEEILFRGIIVNLHIK
ncbi:MAG: hypothetical protein IJ666_05835 [Ruminococcus sp.]|nr:hypothetical protein [Ruminococcus sp.]